MTRLVAAALVAAIVVLLGGAVIARDAGPAWAAVLLSCLLFPIGQALASEQGE